MGNQMNQKIMKTNGTGFASACAMHQLSAMETEKSALEPKRR